jgi:hypothetical protein
MCCVCVVVYCVVASVICDGVWGRTHTSLVDFALQMVQKHNLIFKPAIALRFLRMAPYGVFFFVAAGNVPIACHQLSSMAAKLKQLLQSNSVDSIPSPKDGVIQMDASEQVVHGFQKLLDNNILSAPVWDQKEGKYIGFLDIRDLVSFCVFIHDNNLEVRVCHGEVMMNDNQARN